MRKFTIRQKSKKPKTQTLRKKWVQTVTTDAMYIEPGLFTWKDPKEIAKELKRSALASEKQGGRLRAPPFQAAMSMLNYYINRAGYKLDPKQKIVLEKAKIELRRVF